jgi:parallel beta-helix repeat protein
MPALRLFLLSLLCRTHMNFLKAAVKFLFGFLIPLLLVPLAGWCQCPGNPVSVAPTDNLQNLVTACPSGTTFNLAAGVHYDSVTSLKNGDTFTGQAGAIENGAKVLTGWSQVTINSLTYWTTAGGTPLHSQPGQATYCQSGYPGCYYTQDLYFDNMTYLHVTTLSAVTTGAWYYDFAGGDGGTMNNVYIADDPTGHTVELGNNYYAFGNDGATNITVQGLIIEKYAPNLEDGPVAANASGWLVQNNEVRLNHGRGISVSPGGTAVQVLNNLIHDNGQIGIGCGGSGGTFSGNSIYNNNVDHVDMGFGAGGAKFVGGNLAISYNTVYSNHGQGLWSDGNPGPVTYSYNTVYNNDTGGIRIEVSENQKITNNIVYGNGTCPFASYGCNQQGPQIHYAQSTTGTIQGNVISATLGPGAGAIEVSYGSSRTDCVWNDGTCPPPSGMNISGNYINLTSTTGLPIAVSALDYSSPGTFPSWGVAGMFDNNIYCVPGGLPWTNTTWRWGEVPAANNINFTAWQSDGQDAHGKFLAGSCTSVALTGRVKLSGPVKLNQ